MIRFSTSGGWYCDALPSTEEAIFITGTDAHIETHTGRVDLPGEGLLFVRVKNVGGFGITGKGWDTGTAWEWRAGKWWAQGPSIGNSPCIFDNTGVLYVSQGGTVGVNGYRYCDKANRLWTGDETLSMLGPDGELLHDYTTLGTITIGQGHESGVHVLIDGKRRLLEPGNTTFIRAREENGMFSIALVKQTGNLSEAVRIWATRAELAALPLVGAPVDPPPIEPPIEPPPGGPMEGITNEQFASLQAIRTQYPATMSPNQTGEMLNKWAWQHRAQGLGMQEDLTNPHAFMPDGRPIWTGARGKNSQGKYFGQDVLIGSSVGQNTPTNGAAAVEIKAGDPPFVAPIDPGGTVPPVEPPPSGDLEQRVARLEEQMIVLSDRVNRHLAP